MDDIKSFELLNEISIAFYFKGQSIVARILNCPLLYLTSANIEITEIDKRSVFYFYVFIRFLMLNLKNIRYPRYCIFQKVVNVLSSALELCYSSLVYLMAAITDFN